MGLVEGDRIEAELTHPQIREFVRATGRSPNELCILGRLAPPDIINSSKNLEANLMSVNWIKDADEALAAAKEQNKPLLIDFSAAPS